MNETIITTEAGNIVVAHTLTLGDIVISVILVCILFTMVFDKISRRF